MAIFNLLIIPLEVYFLFFFMQNCEVKRNNICQVSSYIIYMVFVYLLNIFELGGMPKMLFAVIGIFVLLFWNYRITIMKTLCMTCIYLIVLGVSEMFAIGCILFVCKVEDFSVFFDTPYELYGTVLAKTLAFAIFVICRKFQINARYDKRDSMLIFLPFILEICIVIYFIYAIFDMGNYEEEVTNVLIIISIIVILETICNLLLIEHYVRMKNKNREYEKMQQIKKDEAKYHELKSRNEFELRKLYHDFKNYMIYLESKNEKVEEEINAILSPLKEYETFIETNNAILNSILNEKLRLARECGIVTNCLIDFSNGGFLEAVDICAIFGNLLDNAIEYYGSVDASSEKYIEVRVNTVNEMLIIKVANYVYSDIKVKKGRIKTKKEDKFRHGIGLLSVKESVEKYDGHLKINVSETEYVANIVLPICGNPNLSA